jgi:adenosylhomocysteine nucleosidase
VSATEADEGVVRKARVAIVAALPREIAGLVRGTRPDAEMLRRGVRLHRIDGAVVVAAGMGTSRVTLAFAAAIREEEVELVVSTGLAGACAVEVRPGDVMEPALIVDAKTGERFTCDTAASALRVLVTTETIAGVREKTRLRESYGAAIVDMEAAAVARLAQARGLRLRAIKGVSDAHDFEMESMRRFAGASGQFRTAAFALHTALRPGTWSSAMRLGRDSDRALMKLTTALRAVVKEL